MNSKQLEKYNHIKTTLENSFLNEYSEELTKIIYEFSEAKLKTIDYMNILEDFERKHIINVEIKTVKEYENMTVSERKDYDLRANNENSKRNEFWRLIKSLYW